MTIVAAGAEAADASRKQSAAHEGEGGRLASFFPHGRRLAVEGVILAALVGLTVFLSYHFAVRTIRNDRALAASMSWRRGAIRVVREPACIRGEPKTVAGAQREFLAFLVAPAVAASHGVAHAFWVNIDSVDFAQDITTAALGEHAAFLTLQR